jgi:16S rRNA G966 N2-methylase RsmD
VGTAAYTLIFCYPPYRMTAEAGGQGRLADMARALADLGCVAPGAVIMLRAARGTVIPLPWPGFDLFDERSYGSTTLYLMAAIQPEPKP